MNAGIPSAEDRNTAEYLSSFLLIYYRSQQFNCSLKATICQPCAFSLKCSWSVSSSSACPPLGQEISGYASSHRKAQPIPLPLSSKPYMQITPCVLRKDAIRDESVTNRTIATSYSQLCSSSIVIWELSGTESNNCSGNRKTLAQSFSAPPTCYVCIFLLGNHQHVQLRMIGKMVLSFICWDIPGANRKKNVEMLCLILRASASHLVVVYPCQGSCSEQKFSTDPARQFWKEEEFS